LTPPHEALSRSQDRPIGGGPSARKLEFSDDKSFQTELRRRVDEYFRTSGRLQRDCWPLYLKSAIILSCFAASYGLLVFAVQNVWQGLALAVFLGLCTGAIGFNIQHDGGHRAFSRREWVNRVAATTLDLIGGSSYVWRWKHAVIHHTYVNITGYDTDIDLGGLARLSPHHPRRWFHRWQHLYLWPFYGLLTIKWHLINDFRYILIGRVGRHPIARPKRWDLVIFIAGKAAFISLAFVVPMIFHPVGVVLFYYAVAALVLGMVMSLVFQVPHVVEGSEFPLPLADTARMDRPWAVHQVRVTTDFDRHNPVVTWLLGGLNLHAEHHLFPVISHINYPALSKVVEETCREFGIEYKEHESFTAGLVSHYRWLRAMGRPESAECPRRGNRTREVRTSRNRPARGRSGEAIHP
jgi:linoleoyl-CoA desaturase